MSTRFHYFAALVLLIVATGCPSMRPDFWRPGSMAQQQYSATLHDPYPDNDAGPAIDGGRPPEYQNPRPEPVRTRNFTDNWRTGRP